MSCPNVNASRVHAVCTLLRMCAATVLIVCAVPSPARADWLIGVYLGVAGTASNDLTVTPAIGQPFTVGDVSYKGQAFRSPVYYGGRISWFPGDREEAAFGPEVEWTHAKAIAEINPGAQELNAFQQSHGLNFLLANLAYRTAPACAGRCHGVFRGGLGISTPHVESTFRGAHQEQYQRGGFAWQVGAGLDYQLWGPILVFGDARLTRVHEPHLRGAGAEIAGTFVTRHVDFGLAYRFP